MMIFWLVLVIGIKSTPINFTSLTSNIREPLYAKQVTMGMTVNNNPLNVYFITKIKFTNAVELYGKNAILINSLMHAREPYSIQLMGKLFQSIIEDGYRSDLDYFLNNGVFILYPFVNADGYQLALKNGFQGSGQIRKNLNTKNVRCQSGLAGVDINRNFPSSFGTVETSKYACSQQFHGINPFSQQQAMVFKDIFQKYKVIIAIDIHSYGNDWIYPYASDSTGQKVKKHHLYPFYEQVKKQLKARNRRILSCIQSLNYIADGVYIDWALDNNALSFAFQLGKTFRSDSQESIGSDISKAVSDFYLIFKLASMNYQTSLSAGQLIIKSESLANMTLIIKIGNNETQQQLPSGSQIRILANSDSDIANITIKQNGITRIISLKPTIKFNSTFTILIITIALVGLFFSFYSRFQALQKRRQPKTKISQFSLQQVSTISQGSQI